MQPPASTQPPASNLHTVTCSWQEEINTGGAGPLLARNTTIVGVAGPPPRMPEAGIREAGDVGVCCCPLPVVRVEVRAVAILAATVGTEAVVIMAGPTMVAVVAFRTKVGITVVPVVRLLVAGPIMVAVVDGLLVMIRWRQRRR